MGVFVLFTLIYWLIFIYFVIFCFISHLLFPIYRKINKFSICFNFVLSSLNIKCTAHRANQSTLILTPPTTHYTPRTIAFSLSHTHRLLLLHFQFIPGVFLLLFWNLFVFIPPELSRAHKYPRLIFNIIQWKYYKHHLIHSSAGKVLICIKSYWENMNENFSFIHVNRMRFTDSHTHLFIFEVLNTASNGFYEQTKLNIFCCYKID